MAGVGEAAGNVVARPHERVAVLLQMFGGQQRLELAADAIEAVP
jgi:hypothetical protein